MNWALGAGGWLLLAVASTRIAPDTIAYSNPASGPGPPDVRAPSTAQAIDTALEQGVGFLLRVQNPNGSWGSAHRTKDLNIYAPVPGAHHAFRTAVTALCVSALIEVGGHSDPVERAIDRGEAWLFEHLPRLRRATPDAIYNVWGHAYSIQALVRMHGRRPGESARQQRIADLIAEQMARLERYESVDGGWGYYDFQVGAQRPTSSSLSFVNGTVLVALKEAQQVGVALRDDVVQRALAATQRQRKPDFSYLYGEYLKYRPMQGVNRPGGSLGRSQVCNLALRLWGETDVTDAVIKTWLERLSTRGGWLSIARKRPIPHESWFQVAGYFFYYGHYYAARCIELLPPAEQGVYQDQLAQALQPLQERDGSWWDFPFYNYHQQYGTAFALMALHRCRRQ